MDKNLRKIEELFKTALYDNEENPSPKVWNEIDKILDKDNVISIKKKYNNLKKISFFLLILLIALSIYEITAYRNKNAANGINGRIDKEIITENDIISRKKNSDISARQNNRTISKSIDKNNNTAVNSVRKNTNTNFEQLKSFATVKKEKRYANTSYLNLHKKTPKFFLFSKSNKKLKEEKQGRIYNNNDLSINNELTLSNKLKSFNQQRLNKTSTDTSIINAVPQSLDSGKTIYTVIDKAKFKNTKSKERKTSRFSFSVFFSPDFAYYKLKDDKPDNQDENLMHMKEEEEHEFSSTTGALLNYQVNRHFSLQSGITFSHISILAQPQTVYAQEDIFGNIKYRLNTNSGYGYVLPSFSSRPQVGDSLYAFTSTHTLQYFSLPLSVKYSITSGKFNFNALTGIGINYLVNGEIETTLENETENETEIIKNIQGLKKIYFSGLTGLGIDYNLNKKIALTFTPSFKFALNSINKDFPVKSYPNSFGLGFGVTFRL